MCSLSYQAAISPLGVTSSERLAALPSGRLTSAEPISSHPPYDRRDIHVDVFDCASFGIGDSTESCRNLKLQAQFFNGLAQRLRSPAMAGVEVIVVGDHAPIIMPMDEKERMYVDNRVPWVRFLVPQGDPERKE